MMSVLTRFGFHCNYRLAGQAFRLRYETHMSIPPLFDRLRLPIIGSPLFIISAPELVIAQCKAGIVGSFPALNARPQALLDA
jgi:nitronate monooxygenase